jgi:hypothetical protein
MRHYDKDQITELTQKYIQKSKVRRCDVLDIQRDG